MQSTGKLRNKSREGKLLAPIGYVKLSVVTTSESEWRHNWLMTRKFATHRAALDQRRSKGFYSATWYPFNELSEDSANFAQLYPEREWVTPGNNECENWPPSLRSRSRTIPSRI